MLRKAFTMIELVFVITVLGILSFVMIPRLQTSHLQEAADQFIKHIRLAQSHALAQDFYLGDSTQSLDYTTVVEQGKAQQYWFKRWWQVQVHGTRSYSIYSDSPSATAGNALYDQSIDNTDIIAVDIQTGQNISGIDLAGVVPLTIPDPLLDADLTATYNVSITVPDCSSVTGDSTSKRVLFDQLGRPHCNKTNDNRSLNPYDRIMNAQMKIVLTELSSREIITICIEKESGYIDFCQ